jgi:dUTP pyrophosphatase
MRSLESLDDQPVKVEIQRLPHSQGLPLPTAATPGAAGLDLCAAIEGETVLKPGERNCIPTGFAIALPFGVEAQIRPRSGLALKFGITLPNAPGTIDSDYRGEIRIIMQNTGDESFVIRRGDRIAQMVIAPVLRPSWVSVEALGETKRGEGGFGHTGQDSSLPISTKSKA